MRLSDVVFEQLEYIIKNFYKWSDVCSVHGNIPNRKEGRRLF